MKQKKAIRVKNSPLFEQQINKLTDSVKENEIKFDRQLLKAIEREKEILLVNPHRGFQIQKDKIPNVYLLNYGVTNLWKIDLPDFWRLIYTIVGNQGEIFVILLEFMNHKDYDKIFGYRKL